MLALTLRCCILAAAVLIGVGVGLAAAGHVLGVVLLVGCTVALIAPAGVLALEFALVWLLSRQGPYSQLQLPRHLVAAWWRELMLAVQIFGWRQAFRAHSVPNLMCSVPGRRRGVVLVHGFLCNRGLWNPWMTRLRAAHIPYIAVTLEPVHGAIETRSEAIDVAVQRMTQATGYAPLIVAHSMGALVVRAWLSMRGDDTRMQRVITIGAPHQGTIVARYGFSRAARQMRIGSAWLRALEQTETPARRARFICFFSHCDNVILPAHSATLPGAENRPIPGAAHLQLLDSEEVFAEVLRLTALRAGSD